MGLLKNLIVEKEYEPGGKHHIRITDEAFETAVEAVENYTEEYKNDDIELSKALDKVLNDEKSLLEYDSSDFPALEIFSTFIQAYLIQEEINNLPEELRGFTLWADYQWSSEDNSGYTKFVEKIYYAWREEPDKRGQRGALEEFERMSKYIYGDSQKAKEILLHFAKEFGPEDDGVLHVRNAVMHLFWKFEYIRWRWCEK